MGASKGGDSHVENARASYGPAGNGSARAGSRRAKKVPAPVRSQITIHVTVEVADLMRQYAREDDRSIGRVWERAAREFLDRAAKSAG